MAHARTPASKILPLPDLQHAREAARAEGLRVVQCHGCFDIVHPGHIRHLRHARSMGDRLLVTITGDAQIGKGAGRPLIPQELRAENLAELDCVDWVCIDPNPTARELLKAVRPDVYVKGKEYETNADPRFAAERSAVEAGGGRVVFSSGDVVFSSTALIASLNESTDESQRALSTLLGQSGLERARLESLIASFRGLPVVVVGETILDEYVFCDRPGVASESPVLTLSPLDERRYEGGAAIIAQHMAQLGARPLLITGLPRTTLAEQTRSALESRGVEVIGIEMQGELPRKQRMLVGTQKVVRLDRAHRAVLDASAQDAMVERIEACTGASGGCAAAVFADFGLGVLSPAVLGRSQKIARRNAGVLAGDVSGRQHLLREFRGFDLLCPSEEEVRTTEGMFDQGLAASAWSLLNRTQSQAALVTMGDGGLVAFERTPDAEQDLDDPHRSRVRGEPVPALIPHAVDALGCGDALLAAATLVKAAGGSLLQAAFVGSVAAGAHAQRLGNEALSAVELRRALMRVLSATLVYHDSNAASIPTHSEVIEPKAAASRTA